MKKHISHGYYTFNGVICDKFYQFSEKRLCLMFLCFPLFSSLLFLSLLFSSLLSSLLLFIPFFSHLHYFSLIFDICYQHRNENFMREWKWQICKICLWSPLYMYILTIHWNNIGLGYVNLVRGFKLIFNFSIPSQSSHIDVIRHSRKHELHGASIILMKHAKAD